MNLTVSLDGRPMPLVLAREGANWCVNGQSVSALEVEPGIYSVLLNGRSFDARIEPAPEGWAVHIAGRRLVLEVSDPRRLGRKRAGLEREGRVRLNAIMPGKVIRVLVAEGDAVEAGQGILVIEAMKMQNELKAPKAGRIVTLATQVGATVAAGEALAVLE